MQKKIQKTLIQNSFIYLFIALILINTSCTLLKTNKEENRDSGIFNSTKVKVYFIKSNGPEDINFTPVVRKISKDDSPVDASLKELFIGPTKKEQLRGIMTEIPEGTRLINVEASQDEISVNLSSQFVTGGGSATMQLRYLQLYKTLTGIAPKKKVYLLVDGKNLKTIGGEGLEITQPIMAINDYTKKYEKTDQP